MIYGKTDVQLMLASCVKMVNNVNSSLSTPLRHIGAGDIAVLVLEPRCKMGVSGEKHRPAAFK
jgi:hypothetical protein